MNRIITLALLIVSTQFIKPVIAEDINLYPGLGLPMHIQYINPETGILNSSSLTNVKASRFWKPYTAVSLDGNILSVNDEFLLKKSGHDFSLVDLSSIEPFKQDKSFQAMRITPNGKWLLVLREVEEQVWSTHFLDIETNRLEFEFADLLSGFNFDATTFVKRMEQSLIVSERNEDSLNKTIIELNIGFQPLVKFISSSGNRIFCTARVNNETRWFIFDRMINGWPEPKEFTLVSPESGSVQFNIHDIADDGSTLLIHSEIHGLATVTEIDGVWSEPQPMNYTPKLPDEFLDRFYISENGKVIAVQSLKQILGDGNYYFYDAILFLKQPSGEWVRHQVNPPDVDVWPDIHLTKDGTQLFWLSYQDPSAVRGSEQFK